MEQIAAQIGLNGAESSGAAEGGEALDRWRREFQQCSSSEPPTRRSCVFVFVCVLLARPGGMR